MSPSVGHRSQHFLSLLRIHASDLWITLLLSLFIILPYNTIIIIIIIIIYLFIYYIGLLWLSSPASKMNKLIWKIRPTNVNQRRYYTPENVNFADSVAHGRPCDSTRMPYRPYLGECWDNIAKIYVLFHWTSRWSSGSCAMASEWGRVCACICVYSLDCERPW